jgi:hypothetical protein
VVYVSYQPNTHFDAAILRQAADQADAQFLLIQIMARGHVIEEGTQHFLVAGEDRFLLIEPPATASPLPEPSETELSVVASVDDSATPIRVKLVQSKPAQPEPAAE